MKPNWITQCQLLLLVTHPKKSVILGITVSPVGDGSWGAVAVATPKKNGSGQEIMEGTLAIHGHHLVGVFPNLSTAVRSAEAYARQWSKLVDPLRTGAMEVCGCETLGPEPLTEKVEVES